MRLIALILSNKDLYDANAQDYIQKLQALMPGSQSNRLL